MIPLGRPITFRSKDYLTLRPDVIKQEEYELWQPCPPGALGPTSFRYQRWSGDNDGHHGFAYPVRSLEERSCRDLLEPLEVRLHNWLFILPHHLRYSTTSALTTPHILVLHSHSSIAWRCCCCIGHFYRSGTSTSGAEESNISTDILPPKSFDLCQSAASHVGTIGQLNRLRLYHGPAMNISDRVQ
ncbi:hypothetical protein SCP_0105730 [Sparassis crispa]|uniref:Uncharacterized protein n=1 Tax=Sparassis crispa TaxID=139825 RepID=A0A401G698_9APHY|nr:hypothetical protein SCP_0105730 [Sparassis crispa]GBE77691.1 hypothetical protein SCP_0105730 [Sparassis crispa]